MNYKHLTLTLTSLALTCALTACGGGGGSSTPSSKPAVSSTPASSNQPASTAASTAANSSQPASTAASSTNNTSSAITSSITNTSSSRNASSSSANANNKIQISAEEFFSIKSLTGLWRLDTTYSMDILAAFGQLPYHLRTNGIGAGAQTLIANSDNTITEDTCEQEGPVTINIADLSESDFDLDDEDKEAFGCTTTSAKFFQGGANQLNVEMYCDDRIYTSLTFKKVSPTPEMNLGKLSFNASGHSNLSTQTGVCGSLLFNHYDLSFTDKRPQDPEELAIEATNSLTTIDIRAPYNNDYLTLNLTFWNINSPDTLTPGTYQVIYDKGDQTNPGYVSAYLSAKSFAEFNQEDGQLFAETGTVTITAASGTSVKGSYQFTTFESETLSGTFELNLN